MKQRFFDGDVVKLNQLGVEVGNRAIQDANHDLWNSKYLLMLKQQATAVVSRPPSLLDDKVWLEDNAFFVSPEHLEVVHLAISPTKVWCDTCQGTGEIDETLGGESFSSRHTHCPDCDGKGWWERVIAASVDNIRTQQEWTDKHYDNNYALTQKDIERGFVKIDPYFVSKMWKIGSKDDSGALWHCFKTIARFGEKNSREREVKALYAQVKRLAEIEGVDLNNQPSEQTK